MKLCVNPVNRVGHAVGIVTGRILHNLEGGVSLIDSLHDLPIVNHIVHGREKMLGEVNESEVGDSNRSVSVLALLVDVERPKGKDGICSMGGIEFCERGIGHVVRSLKGESAVAVKLSE